MHSTFMFICTPLELFGLQRPFPKTQTYPNVLFVEPCGIKFHCIRKTFPEISILSQCQKYLARSFSFLAPPSYHPYMKSTKIFKKFTTGEWWVHFVHSRHQQPFSKNILYGSWNDSITLCTFYNRSRFDNARKNSQWPLLLALVAMLVFQKSSLVATWQSCAAQPMLSCLLSTYESKKWAIFWWVTLACDSIHIGTWQEWFKWMVYVVSIIITYIQTGGRFHSRFNSLAFRTIPLHQEMSAKYALWCCSQTENLSISFL